VYRGAAWRPDRSGNGNLAPTPASAGRIGNSGVGILRGPDTLAISGGLARVFQLARRRRLDISSPATFGAPSATRSSGSEAILSPRKRPARTNPCARAATISF